MPDWADAAPRVPIRIVRTVKSGRRRAVAERRWEEDSVGAHVEADVRIPGAGTVAGEADLWLG